MKHAVLFAGLICLGAAWSLVADDKPKASDFPPPATNPAFEKMKKLVGTWVAADDSGKPTDQVFSVIKLTAGGSALQETSFPDTPMEMVSIYVPDGQDVVMTHYCMLGNQPQMKARFSGDGRQLNFEFVGGTNLNPQKDKHMHSAVLTLLDDNHYEIEGTAWDNGEPAKEMCGKMTLVRKQ